MKYIKRLFPALLLLILFVNSAAAQEINTAKLDSFFNALRKHDKTMGTFLLSKKGKIIYQKSVGHSNITGKDTLKASAKTLYRVGSISKIFTAAMIFQLIDEKKLSLETKLSTYFPKVANAAKISIGQMLSHTAGMGDYVGENPAWITEPHTKTELLEKIYAEKSHFEPGAKQQYSNSGYQLLAYIIEKITKKPYTSVIKTRIFDKAGLKETLSGRPNNSEILEARSYRSPSGQEVKDIYFPNVIGVGDLLATPADLSIFINALSKGKLVSEQSFRQMKTFTGANTFGMGLVRVNFYEKQAISHTGGTFGTGSIVAEFEAEDLVISFSINGQNYPFNDISLAMLNIYYNKPFEIPSFKEVLVSKADLDARSGNYSSKEMPLKITVRNKENKLYAQATGQGEFPLEAVSADEFRFNAAGIVLLFNAAKKQMILKQGGKTYLYNKDL